MSSLLCASSAIWFSIDFLLSSLRTHTASLVKRPVKGVWEKQKKRRRDRAKVPPLLHPLPFSPSFRSPRFSLPPHTHFPSSSATIRHANSPLAIFLEFPKALPPSFFPSSPPSIPTTHAPPPLPSPAPLNHSPHTHETRREEKRRGESSRQGTLSQPLPKRKTQGPFLHARPPTHPSQSVRPPTHVHIHM